MVNYEVLIAVIGLILTLFSVAMKTMGDIKKEIQATTTFNVTTAERIKMVNYRLDNLEKLSNKLDHGFDDLARYMTNNSDFTIRKH